jgi:membrane protease YdiL (CAAX protease family)
LVVAWNGAADVISDHLGIETGDFASPWKFPMFALGTALTCGLVVGLGVVVWGGTPLRELGWSLAGSSWQRLSLIGILQTALLIAMIVGVYGAFGGSSGIHELLHAIASLTVGQRLFFAVAGIKIAFVEESLFRGDLLRSLSRRVRDPAAMVISSAAFAAYHRTLAPVPLLMKFAMGMIWALSATRTRSLLPSALSHALLWAIVADN